SVYTYAFYVPQPVRQDGVGDGHLGLPHGALWQIAGRDAAHQRTGAAGASIATLAARGGEHEFSGSLQMEHPEGGGLIMPTLKPPARIFAVCLVLALAVPALAATPTPYFSLSTDRTFQPGDKITVHLYTRDVQALEFRLYRVNDPVVFFEQLRSVHGFGGGHYGPKEEIEEKTAIEKFHDWKRGLWIRIRNFF